MPSITLKRAYIEAFKAKWPAHGLPSSLNQLYCSFDHNGDIVEIQGWTARGNTLDTRDFDGPALLALTCDAWEEMCIDDMLRQWGRGLAVGKRVKLSPALDIFMRGETHGTVVAARTLRSRTVYRVQYHHSGKSGWHQAT